MTTFENIYIAELAIRKLIQNDNNSEAFLHSKKCGSLQESYILDLVTLNPVHNTHFLMHSLKGENLLTLYNNMYNYVYDLKNALKNKPSNFLNYTVEWYNNNKRELSYFSGRSIEEVVRKFNYGKLTTPTIFSIKLSPKS